MSMQRIHRYADAGELAAGMAGRLALRLADLQREQDRVHLALAGGRTALAIYRTFASLGRSTGIDTRRLEIWWVSECWVPTTNPHRVSTEALSVLVAMLPNASQVHSMPSSIGTNDPDDAAFSYATELGDTIFDICLLGIGSDGSVAGLFPNHPGLELAGETNLSVIGVTNLPVEPAEQITLSLRAINRSREVWFMASGARKAAAVQGAIEGDQALPAARVDGSVATHWYLDEEAAAGLPRFHCRF